MSRDTPVERPISGGSEASKRPWPAALSWRVRSRGRSGKVGRLSSCVTSSPGVRLPLHL